MRTSEKKKMVIKNAHSKQEMDSIESDFVEKKGTFFNINQILEIQKVKQLQTI